MTTILLLWGLSLISTQTLVVVDYSDMYCAIYRHIAMMSLQVIHFLLFFELNIVVITYNLYRIYKLTCN